MRKLAREAVIFMLAGMLLGSISGYVYVCYDQSKTIKTQRSALWNNCEVLRTRGFHVISDFHGNYTGPHECNDVFGNWTETDWKRQELGDASEPAGFIPYEPTFEEINKASAEGQRIKNAKVKYLENLGVLLIFGPGGFAIGLGVWLFYRLVRFAVKG
jgi:hypothetical protein